MRYFLLLLSMAANVASAYDLPAITLTNRLGHNIKINDIWTDQGPKLCNTPNLRVGQILNSGAVLQISGSCPEGVALRIDFKELSSFPQQTPPQIQIGQNAIYAFYTSQIGKVVKNLAPGGTNMSFDKVEINDGSVNQLSAHVISLEELKQ